MQHRRGAVGVLVGLIVVAAGCGDDDDESAATTAPAAETTAATADTTAASADTTTAGASAAIDPARCEQNEAAGKITFLSSFDFAAAASILDIVVAKERGYFDELCLDVELRPSFSTANYPLVAANQAQISSAGNFSEIVNFSASGGEFVAVADYGKTPIEALVVKPGSGITTLADVAGKTVGVKGDIPPAIVAMLNQAGVARGSYDEVLLDGFDPRAHLEQDIDALPVYKSNEPGQLDAAGVPYELFDPSGEDVPGSFGVIYTSKAFLADHPTAVQDFVRASFKGFADAVADPAAAVAISVAAIDAAGNQNFLTAEGETFRWDQESTIVQEGTPAGEPVGLVDGARLQAEIDAYTAAGVFDTAPSIDGMYDEALAAELYDDSGTLIWPG